MSVYELPAKRVRDNQTALYSQLFKSQIPYGLHIPFDQGYDAHSRRNASRAEDHASSGHFYSPGLGAQIELWITEITADFGVSGQRGQSRMLREFFPRSFNDVTLTIVGNVASTQEYNRLAGFIRESHWKALQRINQGSSADQTITFVLNNQTPGSWHPAKRTLDEGNGQSSVKGAHRPWQVNGYVAKVAAGAVRHEVAPSFSIAFVVTESTLSANTGLWSEIAAPIQSLTKILDLVNIARRADRDQGTGFIANPLTVQQQAAVQQGTSNAIWSITGAIETLKLPF